jgi:hypothetical protein
MPQKQKLKEIHGKLKAWAEKSGDDELEQHLNDLENAIQSAFSAQDDPPEGGNSPEGSPDLP